MSGRIRWEEDPGGNLIGRVATLEPSAFMLAAPVSDEEWILFSSLPGQERKRHYAGGPDVLKAEAERWLAEFVSSLGAVFVVEADDSMAFQIDMARDVVARWDAEGNPEFTRERVLADQVRALLAIADQLTAVRAGEGVGHGHRNR